MYGPKPYTKQYEVEFQIGVDVLGFPIFHVFTIEEKSSPFQGFGMVNEITRDIVDVQTIK